MHLDRSTLNTLLRHKRRRLLPSIILVAAGILLQFIGPLISHFWALIGVLCSAGWFGFSTWQLNRAGTPSADLADKDAPLEKIASDEAQKESSAINLSVLGSDHRRTQWRESEAMVDISLDGFCAILRARFPEAQTIAILFPTADGGFCIRRFVSTSDYINSTAVIYPGVGVIGSLLKEKLKLLRLDEIISDSMTLYYYTKDAGVRSLMAGPVLFSGVERAFIVVDSTRKNAFSDQDLAFLSMVADALGQAVYYTYLSTEHRLEHQRIAAMSNIEKTFFHKLDSDNVLDKMMEIIPFAVSCDRLSISVKLQESAKAVVRRAWGEQISGMVDTEFDVDEKTLAGLLYARNITLSRNFASDHYEVRYIPNEHRSDDFKSFLAIPLGVDQCKATILLESIRRNAFTDAHRDLLLRLATSAGLALEKILIYDTANRLATRDGLTGLCNHRQFQASLKDEITRSLRYKHPLSFVLCDIDFFKKINDSYGHPFGDTILKSIAHQLLTSLREGVDTAARYGGEEFALILTHTDSHSAKETVERIRQTIAGTPYRTPSGAEMNVTMSFGIAEYGTHAHALDQLIEKADKALYRAKHNGRNRVEIF